MVTTNKAEGRLFTTQGRLSLIIIKTLHNWLLRWLATEIIGEIMYFLSHSVINIFKN